MPASKLKTPAGVDHDYNFLSGIERERDRNQKEVVEERGLFTEREVREIDTEKRWRKMWFGEELRFIAADDKRAGSNHPRYVQARGIGSDEEDEDQHNGDGENEGRGYGIQQGGGKSSAIARKIRNRCEHTNIERVRMPVGMLRQRGDTTAWNRRTNGINWCVEWIVYEQDEESKGNVKSCPTKSTRIKHKALESTPLYKAVGDSVAWYRRGQEKGEDQDDEEVEEAQKKRRILIREVKEGNRRNAMQDDRDMTWISNVAYPTQNPLTGTWDIDRGATVRSWLGDVETETMRHHRFYLHKALTPAGKPKELIPLESTETLRTALQGRTVLEFPTVYVLPPVSKDATTPSLPEGHILGSTERRERRTKRKANDQNNSKKDGPKSKRRALDSQQQQQQQQRGGKAGRGGATRGRGRGGVGGRANRRNDAEEGEIQSDAADTTSSDPDTSSDEDEGSLDFNHDHEYRMDIDSGMTNSTAPLDASSSAAAAATTNHIEKLVNVAAAQQPRKTGLGLVDYGSDSDDNDNDEGELNREDLDLSKLNPDNPELVAGAIQEIVGLLS